MLWRNPVNEDNMRHIYKVIGCRWRTLVPVFTILVLPVDWILGCIYRPLLAAQNHSGRRLNFPLSSNTLPLLRRRKNWFPSALAIAFKVSLSLVYETTTETLHWRWELLRKVSHTQIHRLNMNTTVFLCLVGPRCFVCSGPPKCMVNMVKPFIPPVTDGRTQWK